MGRKIGEKTTLYGKTNINSKIKRAVKGFKKKTDSNFIHHLNFRREFEISQWLTEKDTPVELLWGKGRLLKFLRNRNITNKCIELNILPCIEVGSTLQIITGHLAQFLEQFRYNLNNSPDQPLYYGENLILLHECSYFTGIKSRVIVDLIREADLSCYYLNFNRVDIKNDTLNPSLLRFRLPELFDWIDNKLTIMRLLDG